MELVVVIAKAVLLLLSMWREKDAAEKKKKADALHLVIAGIKEEDPSKITAGFARIKK